MAVMDMTTPSQPQPLSFTVLSGTPSAVVLNGNTAIVGYSSDASDLFDLTNPAHPQFLGQLFYVGGSLFIYNGTLFSTGAVPGVPSSALGGIHLAQLQPFGVTFIRCRLRVTNYELADRHIDEFAQPNKASKVSGDSGVASSNCGRSNPSF
jgi:hypothetical protein